MKKILVTAYAANPNKGSEDGTGWNMILEIARHHEVVAITRENNQEPIEKYMAANPNALYERIDFLYFDTPYWTRFWKRGGRGALLYFYIWQFSIVSFIRKNKINFDIAHNLNFHNDWTPSFLWRLKRPMVWGPVGHHPLIPMSYLKLYGWKAVFKDRLMWFAKNCFWKLDPFLQLTKRNAKKILAVNSSVAAVLDVDESKILPLPAVASKLVRKEVTSFACCEVEPVKDFVVLSVGRFVPLKGFDMTIAAFASFFHSLSPNDQQRAKLILVGKGPEEERLKTMVRKYNIEDAVEMIQWIERSALGRIYESACVFFFPSHEGAGMVVPEAMSYSLPVMCYDNYGPGEMVDQECGIKIPYSNYEQSQLAFAKQLEILFNDRFLLARLSKGAFEKHRTKFLWESKAKVFQEAYRSL